MNAIAWSPDGTQIATCGQDGLIKFRDAGSGRETASLLAHAGGVAAIAYSQRGELMASAGADGTVKLWNVRSRKIVATFFGHLGAVRAVAIAPDVSGLASGGEDGTVRIWDIVSRRAKATRWGDPHRGEVPGTESQAGDSHKGGDSAVPNDPARFRVRSLIHPTAAWSLWAPFASFAFWTRRTATKRERLPCPTEA